MQLYVLVEFAGGHVVPAIGYGTGASDPGLTFVGASRSDTYSDPLIGVSLPHDGIRGPLLIPRT